MSSGSTNTLEQKHSSFLGLLWNEGQNELVSKNKIHCFTVLEAKKEREAQNPSAIWAMFSPRKGGWAYLLALVPNIWQKSPIFFQL